ncbi:MAG: response regulator transcription factor [Pseudomonadales bacterium]|nr:response regulator transcription factor [Cellvibrionales bacterium]MBP8030162.1 response regulator transcription factor [Pseudomonadales bacterium]
MNPALDILLVEDDAVFASVLARSLQRRGHRVVLAADVVQARERLSGQAFTHAILDLKLAQESSLPLIPELLAVLPDLQILVLTGYASIQTAVQAVKLGAINYLCKPADTDTILQALQRGEPDEEAPLAGQPLSVDRLEWEHIQRVLAEHDQNISATARALGMHRRTLQRKLAKKPVLR